MTAVSDHTRRIREQLLRAQAAVGIKPRADNGPRRIREIMRAFGHPIDQPTRRK